MQIIKINDVNDERLAIFYRKKEEQLKRASIFIGESELIIERALAKDYEVVSFLIRENTKDRFNQLFKQTKNDIPIYEVTDEVFQQLKGYLLTRDILACFKRKESLNFKDIVSDVNNIVVLENVTNPTNVGAIIRNASGLNYEAVLLTNDCADPLSRRSIRTSMGNVFNIKWTYVDKASYLDQLKTNGFSSLALALRANCLNIDDKQLKQLKKKAIILGNEGNGLSEDTLNNCDYIVKIPMNALVDSLNVASASGIALWELGKTNA